MKDSTYFVIHQLSYLTQIGAFLFLYAHIVKKRFSFFAIWGAVSAVQFIIYLIRLYLNFPAWLHSLINCVSLFVGLTILFQGKVWKKIVCVIGTFFISCIISIVVSLLMEHFMMENVTIFCAYSEVSILGTLMSSDLLVAIILLICWVIISKGHNNGNTVFVKSYIKIFLLIIIIHFCILMLHYTRVEEISSFNLIIDYILQTMIILLLYLQYFAVIKNMNLLEENHLLSVKQFKQENEKRYYELAQSYFNDISKIRHDLNNHLNIAQQLIHSNQRHEAQEIIDNIRKTLDEIKIVQYCSNPLINSIITTKANQNEYKTIDMQFVLKDCDQIPCDTTDLCSLISNLFDNAAKAALESDSDPVLYMESGIVNEFFVLKVTNTAKRDSVPEGIYTPSTKHDFGHGYGLSIIAIIANKYGGSFILEQEEEFVTGTIMFKHL